MSNLNPQQFRVTDLPDGVHTLPTSVLHPFRDIAKDVLSPDEPADSEGWRRYGSQLEYTTDLSRDIAQHGVLEPLELVVGGRGTSLQEGNHRLAAAEMAGLTEVPVEIRRSKPPDPKYPPGWSSQPLPPPRRYPR